MTISSCKGKELIEKYREMVEALYEEPVENVAMGSINDDIPINPKPTRKVIKQRKRKASSGTVVSLLISSMFVIYHGKIVDLFFVYYSRVP